MDIQTNGTFYTIIANLTYAIHHLKVDELMLDHTKTHVNINPNAIEFNSTDFTLNGSGNLSFWTAPVLFYGNGTGQVNMSRLNSSISFKLLKGNNDLPKLKLINSYFDISENNTNATFEGNNDIFTLLELAKGFALPMIVEFLNGTMTEETKHSVENAINGMLAEIEPNIIIPGTDVMFSFGMINEPKLDEGYAPLSLDGTSSCINKTACKDYPGPKPKPPKEINVFGGKGSLQILLSDYVFNSLSVAAFENSIFNFSITPQLVHDLTNGSISLNTDFFAIFIPEMREVYGPGKNITIKLGETKPPTFDLKSEGISLLSDTLVTIFVEKEVNKTVKAFDINLCIKLGLSMQIADNMIKGNISDYTFSLKLIFSDIKDVTLEELESVVNTILKIAIPQINTNLNKGFMLPEVPLFDLSKSEMTLLDRYIRVDINPEPKKGNTTIPGFGKIVKRLAESYQNAKEINAIEAKKPENMPVWLKIEL